MESGRLNNLRYSLLIKTLLLILCLVATLLCGAATAAEPARLPFFAFENCLKVPPAELAATLQELGYDGLSASGYEVAPLLRELHARGLKLYNTYLTPEFDAATNALTAPLRKLIDDLQGSGAALWIAPTKVTQDGKAFAKSSPDGDEVALARLREIADYAEPRGVKIALYPHTWFWMERVEDGVRLANKLNRPGVGATFNLCYNLKGDPKDNLTRSMATWRRRMLPDEVLSDRAQVNLSGNWSFQVDRQNAGETNRWFADEHDVKSWREVDVPVALDHCGPDMDRYTGVGWFRKHVFVPESFGGRRVVLHFEGINYNAKVWVNGKLVGENHDAFLPFTLPINDAVKIGAENKITVRVDNLRTRGQFPLFEGWLGQGGFLREACVMATDQTHLLRTFVEAEPAPGSGQLRLRAAVTNGSTVRCRCRFTGEGSATNSAAIQIRAGMKWAVGTASGQCRAREGASGGICQPIRGAAAPNTRTA